MRRRMLPRKELYEAWEVARRTRRRCRGGRVVDVAGGHGLLAHAMLLLDDTSPAAVVVNPCLRRRRRRCRGADRRVAAPRAACTHRCSVDAFALAAGDLVVSSHACGALTDQVLDAAARPALGWRCCPAATTSSPATPARSPAGWTRRWPSTRARARLEGALPGLDQTIPAASRRRTGCSAAASPAPARPENIQRQI